MSIGEDRINSAETGNNASRLRKIAESAGAGALGLATGATAEALHANPEVAFGVGGLVFLVTYNGVRNLRRSSAENS